MLDEPIVTYKIVFKGLFHEYDEGYFKLSIAR